jgi:hypothetical protein
VPSYKAVEGNKNGDEKAKVGALGEEEGVKATAEKYKGLTLPSIQRRVTEAKLAETES